MKRGTLSTVFGLAALILAGLAQPAAAEEGQPFQAEGVFTFAGVENKFLIYDGIGTGSHVGGFSADSAVHIKGNSGMAEGFITITSANGDEILSRVVYGRLADFLLRRRLWVVSLR